MTTKPESAGWKPYLAVGVSAERCEPRPIDDYRGGHVAGWGGVQTQFPLMSAISEDVMAHIAYAIATFARIVAEDPSLQATSGVDALRNILVSIPATESLT